MSAPAARSLSIRSPPTLPAPCTTILRPESDGAPKSFAHVVRSPASTPSAVHARGVAGSAVCRRATENVRRARFGNDVHVPRGRADVGARPETPREFLDEGAVTAQQAVAALARKSPAARREPPFRPRAGTPRPPTCTSCPPRAAGHRVGRPRDPGKSSCASRRRPARGARSGARSGSWRRSPRRRARRAPRRPSRRCSGLISDPPPHARLIAEVIRPKSRSRYASSFAITNMFTRPIAAGTVRSGQSAFQKSANPTLRIDMPRYIGLRVNRYGPSAANAVVGRMGWGSFLRGGTSRPPRSRARRRRRRAALPPSASPARAPARSPPASAGRGENRPREGGHRSPAEETARPRPCAHGRSGSADPATRRGASRPRAPRRSSPRSSLGRTRPASRSVERRRAAGRASPAMRNRMR